MELPQWLQRKRSEARDRYVATDTPKLRYGLTIRLDARRLALDGKEDVHSEQVVTLAHEGCEVRNLFDVLDDTDVQRHLLSTQPAERTRIDDFQEAFFDVGLFVRVPEGAAARVELTRTFTAETLKEHVLVVLGPRSSLTLIDRYHGDPQLHTGAVEIVCGDGAHARYAAVQYLGEGSVTHTSYRARVGSGARVDWFVAALGGSLARACADTRLSGEGASVRAYGVYLGTGEQQFDLSASTFHEADRSESDMYTRGVLDGSAKAVYRGLIDIAADAFGCNGYQKEETVLVSAHAVADAIPNLEIRNNDVKCSHGASIGRIDDEQLFYLESRGVPRAEAVRMVVEGFFEPLAARLEWPETFEAIAPLVRKKVRA